MMEDNHNDWIGKKIFLVLKSGRKYSGIVKSIDKNFICIKDKFGENVMASISEISSMEVEK